MAQFDTMGFSGLEGADAAGPDLLDGCHEPALDDRQYDYKELLRRTGLRPTRQRLALSSILFSNGNRHLTAEMLHAEAIAARVPVSLATIYNNLHQFTQAGLIRQIAVDGSKAFFDTNPTEHHHFFFTGEHALLDIPAAEVVLGDLPVPPDGFEIARVDVVVRLRRKGSPAR
jgi:Fur family transcriptional regulator, iron response regulator